jgi:hypothetical protein
MVYVELGSRIDGIMNSLLTSMANSKYEWEDSCFRGHEMVSRGWQIKFLCGVLLNLICLYINFLQQLGALSAFRYSVDFLHN